MAVSILFIVTLSLFSLQMVSCQSNGTIIWIESPRITNWGTWGEEEFCPEDQFVYAFRLKTQPDMGWLLDDTALNAIELLCVPLPFEDEDMEMNQEGQRTLTPIRSKEGPQGSWGTVFECPSPLYANGFQLRAESPTVDNTAGNNFRLRCSDGSFLEGDGRDWGSWSGQLVCPRNMEICGLRTQVEDPKPQPADNTGLNNVDLACCAV